MSVYKGDNECQLKKALNSIDLTTVSKIFIGVDGPVNDPLKQFILNLDPASFHVKWFSENRGLAVTLNDLIKLALSDQIKFQYFFRMDSDDISTEDRFRRQLQYLADNSDVDCLGGSAIVINGDDKMIGTITKHKEHSILLNNLCFNSPFIHPTVVFRRKVVENILYPIDTILFEDVKYWYNLAKAGYIFSNLEKYVIYFRMTEETMKRRGGILKSAKEFLLRLEIYWDLNRFSLLHLIRILAIFISKIIIPYRLLYKMRIKQLNQVVMHGACRTTCPENTIPGESRSKKQ